MPANLTTPPYIGRFAPSPTGPLHFGSLVAALASFIHARIHNGRWLVRMEDLDPPRELPGAADAILRCLEDHGLLWDGAVLYQSQRSEAYGETLAKLRESGLIYACDCTRQTLATMGGVYDGRCRDRQVDLRRPHALRLKIYGVPPIAHDVHQFHDMFQGAQQQNLRREAGDPIVKRKEGFFAYQLAVVVDDRDQGITHVVRGQDLLAVTARQMILFQLLKAVSPSYGHLPLALTPNGQKLSKQNLAPPLDARSAGINLWQALGFLGQNPPAELRGAAPASLLDWGCAHWDSVKLAAVVSSLAPIYPVVRAPGENQHQHE